MKVKFSPKFQHTCDICKKKSIVFTMGDEDSKRTVTICQKCVQTIGISDPAELIEKHGKVDEESFKSGVRYEKGGIAS